MLAPESILQNRYRIVRKLGQGGMGAIYEAIDQRVSCVVALKETLVGATNDSKEAFSREAALLANLRHPLLPNVMDYFTEGAGEFLVMEFINGLDLLQLLVRNDGPMTQQQVVDWGIELLKLLEYLHTREPPIIHRDIKPANLKVTKEGELFLLDFGLAKGTSGQMITMDTDRSVPGYTPVYSPLEQILGQGTDQRSDLYALGATLYHLITGQVPVSAPNRFNAIENGQPDPLKPAHQVNVKVAAEVALCIQGALAISRKNRTASARDMRLVLEDAKRTIADRELIHSVEETLVDNLPAGSNGPLVKDENVQFTVYAPQKIKPEKNYTVLAFAHLSKRREDAPADEPDPLAEVKKQAERLLGEQRSDYSDVNEPSTRAIPRGGELTFVPVVHGLRFSPPSRNFSWRKSVHREEFDVMAMREVDGQTLSGSVTVFLGSVVIAEVPLTLSVDSNATSNAEKISLEQSQSARRVRQVFASYSQKDEQIVTELAQVAPLFGSRFLLDRTHLEPGEDRREGLQRLIRDADVFQLFWSNNSMRSPDIVDEIKYAAALGRPGFILPTYWEEPVPRSPDEGLPPPEVDRLQFYRIYPGGFSPGTLSRVAESKLVIMGPPGAEIYLDDERFASIGTSGRVILKSIATGKHILRVTHLGNRADERIIDIDPQQGEQVIQADLAASLPSVGSVPVFANSVDIEAVAETAPAPAQTFETITAAFPPPPSSIPMRMSVAIDRKVICKRCGESCAADEKFCRRCGSVLHQSRDEASAMPEMAPQPASYGVPMLAPKRKRRWMAPLFAGAAAMLFLLVAAPVWFMMNRQPASLATSSNSNIQPTTTGGNNENLFPEVSFTTLTGTRSSLKDFRGQVVVLNYWSTSSVPSRNEIPALNELHRTYGPGGLTVIGISVDDTAEQVKQFQKQSPQAYLIGLQPTNSSLSTSQLPTTYLIDRSGRLRQKLIGLQSSATLQAAIDQLLK
ncbi:MAG TPA: protein kinase [Pyrinomonadaceae bacterium]